jgi:hypothetical protein
MFGLGHDVVWRWIQGSASVSESDRQPPPTVFLLLRIFPADLWLTGTQDEAGRACPRGLHVMAQQHGIWDGMACMSCRGDSRTQKETTFTHRAHTRQLHACFPDCLLPPKLHPERHSLTDLLSHSQQHPSEFTPEPLPLPTHIVPFSFFPFYLSACCLLYSAFCILPPPFHVARTRPSNVLSGACLSRGAGRGQAW